MEGDHRAKGTDSGEERRGVTMLLKCTLVSHWPALCAFPGTRISQSTAVNPP